MPTTLRFHCDKEHDLTFSVPPHTLGIIIVRKGQENNVPEIYECKDFENVGFDTPTCAVCNYCIATEEETD